MLKCSAWHTVKWECAVGCMSSDCSLADSLREKAIPQSASAGIRCCGDVFLRAAEKKI